jgi:hypothetical protein
MTPDLLISGFHGMYFGQGWTARDGGRRGAGERARGKTNEMG